MLARLALVGLVLVTTLLACEGERRDARTPRIVGPPDIGCGRSGTLVLNVVDSGLVYIRGEGFGDPLRAEPAIPFSRYLSHAAARERSGEPPTTWTRAEAGVSPEVLLRLRSLCEHAGLHVRRLTLTETSS